MVRLIVLDRPHWWRIVLCTGVALAAAATVGAERLPTKHYTTADGLPHDRVRQIVRDSRGFLWLGTPSGLGRFDGQRFLAYTAANGLPSTSINHILQSRSGALWIATNGGGVARFDPSEPCRPESSGARRETAAATVLVCVFRTYTVGSEPQASRVNVLHEDSGGRLWAGTDGGVFVLERANESATFRRIALGVPSHPDDLMQAWAFAETKDGALWIGTSQGLVQRMPDGATVHSRIDPQHGTDHVWALHADDRHRLWIGHDTRLLVVDTTSVRSVPGGLLTGAASYTNVDGLSAAAARAFHSGANGQIWIGLSRGLAEFDGQRFRSHAIGGLSDSGPIRTLADDLEGNLWIGTDADGVMKLARQGFTQYGPADGVVDVPVGAMVQTASGDVLVVTRTGGVRRFDGRRFVAFTQLDEPRPREGPGYRGAFLDREGELWMTLGTSLFRFPRLSDAATEKPLKPKAVYTARDGLASGPVLRVFEDSSGDIWVATRQPTREGLVKWERGTGRFSHYGEADALPRFRTPLVFAEAPRGTVWIGFWEGGLARYRDGRFTVLAEADGVPAGAVQALHVDGRGRLWIASGRGGVALMDEPGSERPRVVRHTTANGFGGDAITCLTEDASGRIYLGTLRGLDQLDPSTGETRHYTTTHGLVNDGVLTAFRDQRGDLWFGSDQGLARFVPAQSRRAVAPATFIGAVRISGESYQVKEEGADTLGPLELSSGQNQLQIEFFGLPFNQGSTLRYQYKLEGAEQEWNAPTTERSVNFARLAPGAYRFLVRAVNADGTESAQPATIAFTIVPPLWARWWFQTATAALVILFGFAVYRYRLTRAIELERMRTRIAMDLHDDIGSSLSQVAILSEVVRQRRPDEMELGQPLARIAATSRELVDAMGDIVWSIDPRRDALRELTHRLRRFANETLSARDIQVSFSAPPDGDLPLNAELRREILLVVKECVNNVARHSGGRHARIALAREGAWLTLCVEDDGRGFEPDAGGDGLGLPSMRRRAERIGASLTIASSPGTGTTIELRVPLTGARRRLRNLLPV